MFRVMLVDDELSVRERLKKLIPFEALDMELCAEAEDGQQALELFGIERPHIVITDISMPVLDGLMLTKELTRLGRGTRILIITGYAMLENAKEAIRSGAHDFLVKPVNQDELIAALQKCADVLRTQSSEEIGLRNMQRLLNESLPLLQERYISSLMTEDSTETEAQRRTHLNKLGIPVTGRCFCVALLYPYYKGIDYEDRETFQIAVKNVVPEVMEHYGLRGNLVFDALRRIILLAQDDRRDMSGRLEDALFEARDKLRFHFNFDFAVGIGSVQDNLSELIHSFRGAQEAIDYKNIFGENNIVNIMNVTTIESPCFDFYSKEKAKILSFFKSGDRESTMIAIRHFISSTAVQSGGSLSSLRRGCIVMVAEIYTYAMEINLEITAAFENDPFSAILLAGSALTLQNIVCETYTRLLDEMQKRRLKRSYKIIDEAKHYIYDNLTDSNLNLRMVSEYMGLSNVYFCSLFKEETGINFVDFLNRARVERSKPLLSQPGVKIYEVAYAVGYGNPKYFLEVFKRITGLRPKEYIAAHVGDNGLKNK